MTAAQLAVTLEPFKWLLFAIVMELFAIAAALLFKR